jgi:hypothetical protein
MLDKDVSSTWSWSLILHFLFSKLNHFCSKRSKGYNGTRSKKDGTTDTQINLIMTSLLFYIQPNDPTSPIFHVAKSQTAIITAPCSIKCCNLVSFRFLLLLTPTDFWLEPEFGANESVHQSQITMNHTIHPHEDQTRYLVLV